VCDAAAGETKTNPASDCTHCDGGRRRGAWHQLGLLMGSFFTGCQPARVCLPARRVTSSPALGGASQALMCSFHSRLTARIGRISATSRKVEMLSVQISSGKASNAAPAFSFD
jgi:hypothetical protein